jgi:NDP-sugar pyrophosphorylase family protein
MEAVILAGGKGTRLKPYTTTIPKPLVPVGERPILGIVLEQLRSAGVKKVTLTVNHMSELIMAFFGSGERFGLQIEYSLEDKPLSTVAPVKLIKNLPEHFIVMNGDLLTDIDFAGFYDYHVKSGCELTVATYQRDAVIDFGVIDVDRDTHRAIGFREKPAYHFDVSTGVYVYSRCVLDRVPDDRSYGFDNLMLDMLKDGAPVNIYEHKGYWLDIGRPDDYEQANRDWEKVLNGG